MIFFETSFTQEGGFETKGARAVVLAITTATPSASASWHGVAQSRRTRDRAPRIASVRVRRPRPRQAPASASGARARARVRVRVRVMRHASCVRVRVMRHASCVMRHASCVMRHASCVRVRVMRPRLRFPRALPNPKSRAPHTPWRPQAWPSRQSRQKTPLLRGSRGVRSLRRADETHADTLVTRVRVR